MDIEKNTNKIENGENKPLLKSENFNDNSVKEAKRQISFEDSKGKKSHFDFLNNYEWEFLQTEQK